MALGGAIVHRADSRQKDGSLLLLASRTFGVCRCVSPRRRLQSVCSSCTLPATLDASTTMEISVVRKGHGIVAEDPPRIPPPLTFFATPLDPASRELHVCLLFPHFLCFKRGADTRPKAPASASPTLFGRGMYMQRAPVCQPAYHTDTFPRSGDEAVQGTANFGDWGCKKTVLFGKVTSYF
jgi:hypothetical protein